MQTLPSKIPTLFDGVTFDRAKDGARLHRQLSAVREFMSDSSWRTLAEIEEATGHPRSSISARLRDLRKPKFGGFTVERRRRSPGTFEYRVMEAS